MYPIQRTLGTIAAYRQRSSDQTVRGLAHFWRIVPNINGYFFISFVTLVFLIAVRFPTLAHRAEVWAEAGTNFFFMARYESIWENLQKDDCGYLPLMQRCISLAVVKGFGITANYPNVIQAISLVATALFCSMYTLRVFRRLLADDLSRFLICLVVGVRGFACYDLYSFINFPYFGIVFLILAPWLALEQMSRLRYVMVITIGCLIILSKGMFVLMGPIAGFGVFWAFCARDRRRGIFFIALGLAAAIQTVFIVNHPEIRFPEQRGLEYALHEPFSLFVDWFYTHANTFNAQFAGHTHRCFNAIPLAFGIRVAVFLLLLTFLYRLGKPGVLWFFLYSHAVGAAAIALVDLITPPIPPTLMGVPGIFGHQSFIAETAVLLGTVVGVLNLLRHGIIQRVGLVAMLLPACFYPPAHTDIYTDPVDSPGDWRRYCHLLKEDSVCVPINPRGWFILRNCRLLFRTHTPVPPLTQFELHTQAPDCHQFVIHGVFIQVDNPSQGQLRKAVELNAIDERGMTLDRARCLTEPEEAHQYYLFPQPLRGVHAFQFSHGGGNLCQVRLGELTVFGN